MSHGLSYLLGPRGLRHALNTTGTVYGSTGVVLMVTVVQMGLVVSRLPARS